ncbi:MAG: hypothetical protein IH876_15945 [Gemmatimonadetes bacterium]|nr:hypothetical protein [Gemmatimonadota bacterium]
MTRLSQRVSAMWTTVKCPKCDTLVPVQKPSEVTAPPQPSQGDGKRWSFIWLMPRGDFCPECDFPLSKYFGRLKWIRTVMVGVSIVLVALVLQVIGAIGQFGAAYLGVMRDVIRAGVLVFGVGAVGVVVGGRRKS